MENERIKCLIIGSGPAGYTAAIYTSRANLNPVLYEGMQPGGQLTTTSEIENFPGYPEGVGGFDIMEDMKKQALRFGADIRDGFIEKVDLMEKGMFYRVRFGMFKTKVDAKNFCSKYIKVSNSKLSSCIVIDN